MSVYNNAKFYPIDIHFMLANISSVNTSSACVCECIIDVMCITVYYNGYAQNCVLFSAEPRQGQLTLATTDTNSVVVSFKNKSIKGMTSTTFPR